MKVGLGIEQDVAHVKAVRKAIGKNMEVMIDSNHANLTGQVVCIKIHFFSPILQLLGV